MSDEELEAMPDKIGAHFDRVRDLLATKFDGDADINE